jgi:hypothetical protein
MRLRMVLLIVDNFYMKKHILICLVKGKIGKFMFPILDH